MNARIDWSDPAVRELVRAHLRPSPRAARATTRPANVAAVLNRWGGRP